MKRLVLTALLVGLLAGCADKPIQEASIEDRAIGTQDRGARIDAPRQAGDSTPAPTRADVQTRGIAAADAELKPLTGVPGGIGGPGNAGQPPRDPAVPLVARRIHFDFDSAAIRDEYRSLLEAHAAYLKQNPRAEVVLQGHTDERGSREYNLALGQHRAESVRRALNLLGVAENRIEAVSMGEEKPIAEGQHEGAWSQNRRAEILYVGE